MSEVSRSGSSPVLPLEQAAPRPALRPDSVGRTQTEAFQGTLRSDRRRASADHASFRGEIDALTRPVIADPGILGADRMASLLDHVIRTVLPRLDAEKEIADIARVMLEEEIDCRRDLQSRLNEVGEGK